MGGSHSTSNVTVNSSFVANAVLTASQDSITYASGDQKMIVDGSGNIFTNNSQLMTITVSSLSKTAHDQNVDFMNKLQTSIAQNMKSQTVALTGWLNDSSQDSNASISNTVTDNITVSDIQKCVNTLDTKQIMLVSGNNNVYSGNNQKLQASLVAKCLSSGSQSAKNIADATNMINQQTAYVSKNPLAFLTDWIASLGKNIAMVAVLGFVLLVAFVIVLKGLHHHKGADKGAPAPGNEVPAAQ